MSLPSKLQQVDTQGRRTSAFQESPLHGKALGLPVPLLPTVKTGAGVEMSVLDVFLLTAIMR